MFGDEAVHAIQPLSGETHNVFSAQLAADGIKKDRADDAADQRINDGRPGIEGIRRGEDEYGDRESSDTAQQERTDHPERGDLAVWKRARPTLKRIEIDQIVQRSPAPRCRQAKHEYHDQQPTKKRTARRAALVRQYKFVHQLFWSDRCLRVEKG